jgi:[acyl-carrier-protein] S-malonyltransferase
VTTAIVFPGQAAEEPGMGLALAAIDARARRLLDLASSATGVDVPQAIERGGRALTRTDVLQPALVAVSLGAAHALARRAAVDVVLGHSLGELAAACFALDVDDETAIALAADRGRRMAEAAAARPGGMIAVPARPADLGSLVLAAHNADDEWILSGDEAALGRGSRLRVSGAWHSPAMAGVVAPFLAHASAALAGRSARARLLSAVDARVAEPADVSQKLASGLVSPVRWVETLRALPGLGVTHLAMAPPGRLSRSLVRRTLGTTLDVQMLDVQMLAAPT